MTLPKRHRWSFIGGSVVAIALLAGCQEPPQRSTKLAVQGVYTATLSPNGELALIGSMNHGGSLWQADAAERLFNWNHTSGDFTDLSATALSFDGSKAVTADPRTLVVWDTNKGNDIAYWATPAAVLDLAVSDDAQRLLMGLEDHSALLIDPTSGDHLHTLLHQGPVGAVALSADATRALTGSDDDTAIFWDLASGASLARLQHDNPVRVVALSPAGDIAFTASQNREVLLWNTADGTRSHELSARNTGVISATFSADGERLLIGYVNRRVELWSVADGRRLTRWSIPSENPLHRSGGAVLAVGFATRAGTFLALSGDGQLQPRRS